MIKELLIAGGLFYLYKQYTNNPLQPNSVSNTVLQTTLTDSGFSQSDNGEEILRNYAYVNNYSGTNLYRSVGDMPIAVYGYGRSPILSLPNRTYLGKATGKQKNGLIEIATTINVRNINFWVNIKDVILCSMDEYLHLRNTVILEKSTEARNTLLNQW